MSILKQEIEKAAMSLSDLSAGGQMLPEQQSKFYRKIIDAPTIIKDARSVFNIAEGEKIEKLGFGSRILRATPGEGTALADNQISKPTTGTIVMAPKEVICEIDITYDTIENNIENGNLGPINDGTPRNAGGLEDTIMSMLSERVALDLEELIVNGSSFSSDSYLQTIDGMKGKAISHVVDFAGQQDFSKACFTRMYQNMYPKYMRNPSDFRFYVPYDVNLKYRDQLTARQTILGDAALEGAQLNALGIPIVPVAKLENYDLDGNGLGTAMGFDMYLTVPKNLIVAFGRNVRVEIDTDIRARKFIVVVTAKVDFQFEEEDMVVKGQGIKALTF